MEFISAEEFLKQPIEIQKVFLDWWINEFEKDKTDLMPFRYGVENIIYKNILDRASDFEVKECIPLLTEGQLRKFIEDKTNGHVDLAYYVYKENGFRGYTLEVWEYRTYKCIKSFKDLGEDLLQAYWKAALEIIKEEQKQ